MGFWKKIGVVVGGIAAYMGRGVITAHYGRGVQYATDTYIKFIGGALFSAVTALLINFILMATGSHGMQTMLALLLFPVSLYYLFAPKISLPLIAAASANEAAREGDQANVWLIRDGIKNLASIAGVALFWIEAYILITMIAPFDLYPAFFWVLHIPLVGAIALLMTGKIDVNPEVYHWSFRISIGLLVAGVLTVMIYREQLGPWWAAHTANRTSRIVAEQTTESIRNADRFQADWIKKNVFVNEKGEQVVIVDGRAVNAKPYIDAAKKKRDEIIRSATNAEASDGTPSGKKSGGWWGTFTEMRTTNPSLFWTILILAHLPLIWLYKKWKDNNDDTGKVVTTKTVAATSNLGFYIELGIVIGLALLFVNWIWHPTFLTPLNEKISSIVSEYKEPSVPAPTTRFLTSEQAGNLYAYVISPKEHPYAKEQTPMSLEIGAGFLERMTNTSMRTIGWTEDVLRIKSPDGEYRLKQTTCTPPAEYSDGRMYSKCTGKWSKGARKGMYELTYNSFRRIAVLESDIGPIEMEFR